MPSITVRPFEERDRDAFFHVRSVVYEDARPVPVERRVFKNTSGFVAEVGGEIAGVFSVLDLTATRGDALLRCAGIAGVGVLPQYRRTGVGGTMMSWALNALKADGYHLASLYAFRESYYRDFGYEVCGGRWKIEAPNHRYPRLTAELPVRTLTPGDYGLLEDTYRKFASTRSGMNVRKPQHWERVLSPESVVYAAGDPIEGYAVVHHDSGFWLGQMISEFVWSTRRGYEAVLSVFAGIGINKTSMAWFEPPDSPFIAMHYDQGISAKLERPIMFRVLDVPACLQALRPGASGRFSFELHDAEIPENGGTWDVCFDPDRAEVARGKSPGLSMDRKQFSPALLGMPSLMDLARNELIEVHDRKALSQASLLLPATPVYCTEFF